MGRHAADPDHARLEHEIIRARLGEARRDAEDFPLQHLDRHRHAARKRHGRAAGERSAARGRHPGVHGRNDDTLHRDAEMVRHELREHGPVSLSLRG